MSVEVSKNTVHVESFIESLEGDVRLESTEVHMVGIYEYTIIKWMHDGTYCIDIFSTEEGKIDVYAFMSEVYDTLDEAIFESVYTGTYACLRTQSKPSESLSTAFIEEVFA